MSTQKSSSDLVNEVLLACGELTDGSSLFATSALSYLNDVYSGLLAGGNLFGSDVAEPWVWAQATRPLNIALQPPYDTVIALTADSASAVLTTAPAYSLEGWFIILEGLSDIYNVAAHTASSTALSLDQVYLGSSGTINCKFIKLDYQLTDDVIIINSRNNVIDFRESSTSYAATLTKGSYSPTSLCAEIKTQMEALGALTYTISFNSITRKFNISASGAFDLLFATGSNVYVSSSELLGYECQDYEDLLTYDAAYALNGILRFTKPLNLHKSSIPTGNAKDDNKVFLVDDNAFAREFPISRMVQAVPDKYCTISRDKSDIWTIRFNAYIDEETRVEIPHIPVRRKLTNTANSFPLVPAPYNKFLVYGAAHFIMLDKSDDKATFFLQMAQAQLKALVNDNRKGLQLSGNKFGQFVPRPNQASRKNFLNGL